MQSIAVRRFRKLASIVRRLMRAERMVRRKAMQNRCATCRFFNRSSFLACAVDPVAARTGDGCDQWEVGAATQQATHAAGSYAQGLSFTAIVYDDITDDITQEDAVWSERENLPNPSMSLPEPSEDLLLCLLRIKPS